MRISTFFLLLALILFLVSLTQPAFSAPEKHSALMVFLTGWMGVLIELVNIATCLFNNEPFPAGMAVMYVWLANPLLIISGVLFKRHTRLAIILAALATAIILSFMLFGQVVTNEAGSASIIAHVDTGYWLWLSSGMVLLLGGIYCRRNTPPV